jgi:hypothetical protein
VLEWIKGMMSQGLVVQEIAETRLILLELTWELDRAGVASIDPTMLPPGWERIPNPDSVTTQQLGNAWLDQGEPLALRVPSAALPCGYGWNILINSRYREYPPAFPPEHVVVQPFDLKHYLGLPEEPIMSATSES